jgi:hypothetical protein
MSVVVTGWYAMSVGLAVQTLEGTLDDTGCSSLCVPQAVFVVLECLGGDALLVRLTWNSVTRASLTHPQLYRVIVIWKRDLRVAIPLSIAYAALSGKSILRLSALAAVDVSLRIRDHIVHDPRKRSPHQR